MPDGHPLSIVEFSTLNASFEEDLAAYSAAGVDGIGICELKLVEGRESEHLAAFRESGLKASACIPTVPSFLPLAELPGPESPDRRVDAILAGMRRLAPFEPTAFVCLTGAAGHLSDPEARAAVVEGLRTIAAEGRRLGVPVGLEAMSPHYRDGWTIPTTLGEAAALVEEAEADGLGLIFDTWQLWDSPRLFEEIDLYAARIVAVHVADWRQPTRSWGDRVLPGDGVVDLAGILEALESAGWNGFYELEIFSDDGTFGNPFEDSLWRVPAAELASRGRDALVSLKSTVF